jgi:hypothetical protein
MLAHLLLRGRQCGHEPTFKKFLDPDGGKGMEKGDVVQYYQNSIDKFFLDYGNEC